MAYQVLARKWRPQRFDEVVGQQAVTRTLRNALKSGRLAQAFVFAGLALFEAGPAADVVNFRRYITSLDGIFFWQRVLFGLAGPAVLSYLTWETAKIRSTQSATGILYVDFFTVVVGEVLAKYLLLATRVPL